MAHVLITGSGDGLGQQAARTLVDRLAITAQVAVDQREAVAEHQRGAIRERPSA